jgi:precorrin-3B C17-methyltransferase
MDRTPRAGAAISRSRVVVGYAPYLENISDLIEGKERFSSGMTREEERCRRAVELARDGETVSLVSSGDSGVYGMAGLAIEIARKIAPDISIEIVPGISAANAAAAAMGAPLMLDYAVISLSDLLVPWEMIRKRLTAVAAADLVTALYNPRSKKRIRHLEEAVEIFLRHRPGDTPAGVGTAVGTDDEEIVISTLGEILNQEVGMRSIVIIGNTHSKWIDHWFVTPRGYRL